MSHKSELSFSFGTYQTTYLRMGLVKFVEDSRYKIKDTVYSGTQYHPTNFVWSILNTLSQIIIKSLLETQA